MYQRSNGVGKPDSRTSGISLRHVETTFGTLDPLDEESQTDQMVEYARNLRNEVENIWIRDRTKDKFIELKDVMQTRSESKKLVRILYAIRAQETEHGTEQTVLASSVGTNMSRNFT